jgi:chemotaxis protein CheZ
MSPPLVSTSVICPEPKTLGKRRVLLRRPQDLAGVIDLRATGRRILDDEEIKALRHGDSNEVSFTTAADELEEIVSESTTATNTIMGAAEAVEDMANKVDNPDIAARLREEATRVYEACTFQDITGQRIAKVVRTLQSIEKRVNTLALVCGADIGEAPAGKPATENPDGKLLNGPALPSAAKTQDEIDRLFDSL